MSEILLPLQGFLQKAKRKFINKHLNDSEEKHKTESQSSETKSNFLALG